MTIIEVTQEDIDKGCRCAQNCPIALAANRQLEGTYSVDGLHIRRGKDKTPTWVRLPQVAVDFVYHFDSGDHVEPFSFEVEIG